MNVCFYKILRTLQSSSSDSATVIA